MVKRLKFDSIEPAQLRHVEFTSTPQNSPVRETGLSGAATRRSRRRSRVIVKVAEPGYVPEGFEVAVRLDDTIFTALAGAAAIDDASNDDKVVSVARGRVVSPSE
jgi:hypothetical protein